MKYRLIRALDVAGLKVLEPIVLLAYREEPKVQLKKIGLFLIVPMATFALFLAAWSYIGPRHKTKSGEVPGPTTVIDAWDGIVRFASREKVKSEDFRRTGEGRENALTKVREESEKVKQVAKLSNARFAALEKKRTDILDRELQKYELALQKKEDEYQAAQDQRKQSLKQMANDIDVDDANAKTQYLQQLQAHLAETESESEHLKAMRTEIAERREEKWPLLEAERQRKNSLDQTKQYLQKREAFLTSGNRELRVDKARTSLVAQKQQYLASSGSDLFETGMAVVKSNERLKKIAEAEYAQPPTFFMQIRTSLACVFLGFLIATAIAIPIGVLCGLSPVFMAAMSPLISLFKPVSPIVWLPIVFIIVGGFQLPEVTGNWAWLFTPSFLASAITVALCSLWPTLVNTALGVASIDQDHVNVARVLKLGFWSRLFKIVIPSALPLIFAGLRISLGVGWMVLIAAELLSSSPGLGKFVWDMFNNGSSETFSQMFVVVFVVGIIGLLLDRIMIVFQRLVSFDGGVTSL